MDNIDISFGDDILIGQEPGINIDEQNNVEAVSDTIGIPGEKGDPGFSPIANVTQTANGAIISITDEQGTTTATVLNGEDGVSPSASVTQTASGAVIEITDVNGTTTANVSNGEPGSDGQNATIAIGSVTSLSYGSTPTVTNTGTATNAVLNWGIPEGQRGEQGVQGEPGINAQAYVTQNTGSATITIEDADGTTTATVYDGQNGTNGQDGYSPSASVTQNTGSATISITDLNGTTTATIYDGQNGTNGVDGFSPVANVTQTASGATISITDSQGTTSANVTNGTNGQSATITVGSTVTGPAGSSASVVNSGSSTSAVLDFVIPKGDTGASGVGITTKTDTGGRIGYYFDDGLLICRRTVTFSVAINTAWGSLYRGVNPDFYSFCPSSGTDFIEKPTVSITPLAGATQSYWMGAWENGAIAQTGQYNVWAIPTGSLSFIRPSSSSSTNVILEIIAIGKWK